MPDSTTNDLERLIGRIEVLRTEAESDESYRPFFFRAAADSFPALVKEIRELRAGLVECQQQIEFDRSAVAAGVTALKKEMSSRLWLTDGGRGCYEWDDDRYVQEFCWAWEAIQKALEPLERVAQNMASSPRTTEEVIKARVDLRSLLDSNEAALVEARAERERMRKILTTQVPNLERLSDPGDEYAKIDPEMATAVRKHNAALSAIDVATSALEPTTEKLRAKATAEDEAGVGICIGEPSGASEKPAEGPGAK